MLWIIILVILVIAVKFITSLNRDKDDLTNGGLQHKFTDLVNSLNKEFFNGVGKVTVVDSRTFNLYQVGSNQIIQFFFSTGNLSITWRSKVKTVELVHNEYFNNVRNVTTDMQIIMAKTVIVAVSRVLKKHKILSNTSPSPLLIGNVFEIDKFLISSLFYQFCFSADTAKIFLGNIETRILISKALVLSAWEEEKFCILILKDFLKRNNYSIAKDSLKLYRFNSYEFFMEEFKFPLVEDVIYFEVLHNNFQNVKNSDGDDLAVANYFIIYVEDRIPNSLFVIVNDPHIAKLSIRQLHDDGRSSKINFADSYENAMEILITHVLK